MKRFVKELAEAKKQEIKRLWDEALETTKAEYENGEYEPCVEDDVPFTSAEDLYHGECQTINYLYGKAIERIDWIVTQTEHGLIEELEAAKRIANA